MLRSVTFHFRCGNSICTPICSGSLSLATVTVRRPGVLRSASLARQGKFLFRYTTTRLFVVSAYARRLRWVGHVARMGESRNAYNVLVGRPEGERPLGRSRPRWEDNIKTDLREVGYDDRDWINLEQDRDRWRAYVRAAMNLRRIHVEKAFLVGVIDERLKPQAPSFWVKRPSTFLGGKQHARSSSFDLRSQVFNTHFRHC
ncbi:hypothetical protein ANN_02325 [Periplaneta americana]|uniref:Uncharacterized protein n=1 Tax=Periplaneta americana TaxID=6978 RepID=A0ABQ8TXQ7_PERAM|nr:hypothetical protein ANN_02325 [Periplaneta americana]